MLLVAGRAPAQADWVVSAYLGTSKTATNTVTIEPKTGGAFDVGPISYETFAFESPAYYGGRLTFFLPAMPWLGVGLEFTHNKAIADVAQLVSIDGAPPTPLSDVLRRLELSNGLNFALANVVVRRPIALGGSGDRIALMAYGGLGAAVPHVETTFAGEETFEYQVTGLGWQAGGGAEWRIASGLSAIADLRVTGGRQRLDMKTGTLVGAFTSTQVDFGIGWHFGRAPAASSVR
jgi:opacity protein-like surface antigen